LTRPSQLPAGAEATWLADITWFPALALLVAVGAAATLFGAVNYFPSARKASLSRSRPFGTRTAFSAG
jgi:hypothetical protein